MSLSSENNLISVPDAPRSWKRSHIKSGKEYLLYDLLAYRLYEDQSNGIIVICSLHPNIMIANGYAAEEDFAVLLKILVL
jgi:hypothetical protein